MAGSGGDSSGRVDNESSYVIVLIPAPEDDVWKISSEKIPHLTLCFLGDQLENVQRVREFVGHIAKTSLSKITLGVDKRGVLGKHSADVLHFVGGAIETLEQTRTHLLSDNDIFTAYGSVEQFATWKPHLTLGYPKTPAKTSDLGTPYAVTFDRIALWTGDFEGVEFPLKEVADELSMTAKGEAFLQHYGIKGMKWGITREQAKSAVVANYKPSPDAINAKKAQTKAKLGGVRAMTNQEMRQVINRMELEQRYRDLYGERQYHDEAVSKAVRYSKRGARWAGRLLNDILKDAGSSWLKRPGSNTSGSSSARVRAWTTGQQFAGAIDGSIVSPRAIGR